MANWLYLHDSYITKFNFMNYAFAKLVLVWLFYLLLGLKEVDWTWDSRHAFIPFLQDPANVDVKPQLHNHDFHRGKATIHPDLSNRDALVWFLVAL